MKAEAARRIWLNFATLIICFSCVL